MPADPKNVAERIVLSGDYHDDKVKIDFYTNSAIAIYRGDEDNPEGRVWLDNLEKQALQDALDDHID